MDGVDDFPLDPFEWEDSDLDGVGDNGDAFPNDPDRQEPEESTTMLIFVAVVSVVVFGALGGCLSLGEGDRMMSHCSLFQEILEWKIMSLKFTQMSQSPNQHL